MAQNNGAHEDGRIEGISLASFLQLLEQERKSCTLIVSSGDQEGRFYFEEGVLVDADSSGESGQEAVSAILSWPNPSFSVARAEDRMHRITLPLAHILLAAAKIHDESQPDPEKTETQSKKRCAAVADFCDDPAVARLVQIILSSPGVHHYFILDRHGKVVTQSSRQLKLADFITYCIVSGIQMRNRLKVKGPDRIHLVLDNGESLLIMPGAGMIIGLLLDEYSSVSDIEDQLRPVLACS
ncbi:hypothetical protein MNBD_DELTA04-1580 [hydrothermal vent metagenome]|uniref:PatA-like N-terminal domain-containing protein n=1 Tax=hydrothermal vent metagenome TaxID=652676 RepID=A0A3B0UTD5_9ZZZZ